MSASAYLLAPVYWYQGQKLKRSLVRLPEAAGARHGKVALAAPIDTDQTLRLMIIGDSAAAGVGAMTQDKALSGQLLTQLQAAPKLQARFSHISWWLYATSGHTSFQILRRLFVLSATSQPLDMMIVNVGVNDTLQQVSIRQWQQQIEEIIVLAQRKFATKHIVFSGLPPMAKMPALPSPLNDFIGHKAGILDQTLQHICDQFDYVSYAPTDLTSSEIDTAKLVASDGLHPSSYAYTLWASKLSAHIIDNLK